MGKRLANLVRIVAISFVAGLTLPGASLAQQARVKPVGRAVVVDSQGKVVGTTLGGASMFDPGSGSINEVRPKVLLDIDEHVVAVSLGRDRLYGGSILLFDSTSCSGNAWYPPASSGLPLPLLPRAIVGPPGQTLFVETLGVAPQTVTTKSRFINGSECVNFTFTAQEVPMQPLVDLLTIFTPPFSLRAAP